jgi:hypothetical protein
MSIERNFREGYREEDLAILVSTNNAVKPVGRHSIL